MKPIHNLEGYKNENDENSDNDEEEEVDSSEHDFTGCKNSIKNSQIHKNNFKILFPQSAAVDHQQVTTIITTNLSPNISQI